MVNKNLIAIRRKERYDNLDKATQRELDIFFTEKASGHQLQVIEKSNLKPAVDDFFRKSHLVSFSRPANFSSSCSINPFMLWICASSCSIIFLRSATSFCRT